MQLTKYTTWPWWFWLLIITVIILFAPVTGRVILNVITRGKRLTWTEADDNGDIPDDPNALADAAANQVNRQVNSDDYALARMFASEGESYSQNTKVAIGWVAKNVAAARGVSVTELLTTDSNAHGNGKYGKQTGRWASTLYDPYEGDLTIAQAINNGQVGDITNGATHYYEPSLQERLLALGKVTKGADAIDNAWAAETGNDGFFIPNVDQRLKFYSPNGAPAGATGLPSSLLATIT